ncbi:hypothetical protein F1904_12385 [Akkermansia muciniphila]|uniref:hypothetical protein n=1 Tax=Akkermansia muciniphila TaxID=239935 RepID=UPI00122FAAD4|nr:hypothetical protein F1904_12385 [Akkermansia muciniphila]
MEQPKLLKHIDDLKALQPDDLLKYDGEKLVKAQVQKYPLPVTSAAHLTDFNAFYYKDDYGMITISSLIEITGTVNAFTPLAILPQGSRPLKKIAIPVLVFDYATENKTLFFGRILPNGELYLENQVPGAASVTINVTYLAEN